MKTLKDVYIKVTKRNKEELYTLLNRKIRIGYFLYFLSDDIKTSWLTPDIELNKQKVSLSQLKRLIETIPTREEITRLKRQVSAYKTNYDKVVKYSLSKEEVIEELQRNNSELIQKLIKANRDLKSKYSEIHELKEERDSLDSSYKSINKMYDESLKLNNDILEGSEYFRQQYRLAQSELERLKNKKWYQIWR